MPPFTRSLLPYLIALVSGCVWGLTFSLARLATEAGRHPLGLAFWQAAGGALVLLVYCRLIRQPMRPQRRYWRDYFSIALLGNALPGSLLFYAAPLLPAGLVAIIISLCPMLTYAAAVLLSMERYRGLRVAGVVTGFIAVAMIVLPQSSLPENSARWWLLIPFAAVLAYTGENIYVDRYLRSPESMASLLAISMLLAALMLVPLLILQDAFVSLWPPLDLIDWTIIAMSFISSAAYLMYLSLIRMSGAVFASMSGYVVTLAGVGWAIWIFAEQHSGWIWGALVLMCTGMLLVTPRKSKLE